MNFNESKLLLKKIQSLHDSAEAFGGQLSALEKDLMRHYLRELYEMLSVTPSEGAGRTLASREKVDIDSGSHTTVPEKIPAQNVDIPEEVGIDRSPSPQNAARSSAVPDMNLTQNGQSNLSESESLAEPSFEPEALALFDDSQEKSSSRFESLPISDLTKSMGINDRISTINHLFGGDQQKFQACLHHLNQVKSFDEAQEYLLEKFVTALNWTDQARKPKAENFIRLVRRRYL